MARFSRSDLKTIKWVCFVRDFNSGEAANPERLLRKTFAGRPRTEGLFLRARLTDGDLIEGIASNDLSLISGEGLFLTPPDIRSNTQRLWIPASLPRRTRSGRRHRRRGKEETRPSQTEDRQESLF